MMNLKEIETIACDLLSQYEKDKDDKYILKAEKLLEDFIANNPYNTQARIRYALFEFLGPYEDDYKAIEYLSPILQYDSQNAYAFIILAYIYVTFSLIPKEVLEAVCNLKVHSKEIESMLEYIKALYYSPSSNEQYKNHLIKSIQAFKKHVLNYYYLGKLYIEEGRLDEARQLIKSAIKNVQYIYPQTSFKELPIANQHLNKSCIPSIEDFLNERIKGTYITGVNFEAMQELLNTIS